jgi:peptidoglycan/xylan/chitin deacetylase (PgdA/CDA1 family)
VLKVSHSRYNELKENELAARGYEILTRSDAAGVDIFARQLESRFIFFQGHPEYDASSLQREYMRDLARFLAGERDNYPDIPAGYFDARTVEQLERFELRARANRDPVLAAELPGLTLRSDLAAGAAADTIFRQLAWLPSRGSARARIVAEVTMTSWSNFRARVSNRLARHLFAAPVQLKSRQPMVSFTFDDIPVSAATVGAPMLEDFGGIGTFYVAGGLVNRRTDQGDGIDPEGIVKLRRSGHEIACHTFSHQRAIDLDASAMAAEIEQNRRFLEGLDASIKLENFAYPYGLATVARKRQLTGKFRSARGILPGVNRGTIDLQFLRSTPLIDRDIDRAGIDDVFDEAVATGGWLIFYTHDVAATPSPWGCTPALLRHALEVAKRRDMPMVSVAEALRRAGV